MTREQSIRFLEIEKYIPSKKVQSFVDSALRNIVKDEFFKLPASSSGKYHPNYALGDGGLVRHTKAAVIIAHELFQVYDFSSKQESYIIGALMLHDIDKPEKEHSMMARETLKSMKIKDRVTYNAIIPLIESHMGKWNLDGKLKIPHTTSQEFVHLCDYLASRKIIEVKL